MNRIKITILAFLYAAAAFTAPVACVREGSGQALVLHYPEVTDIGPSMSFISGKPSYKGPKPYDFAITATTLDNAPVETSAFKIDAASGAVTISGTETLGTGKYRLSIACKADGKSYDFQDIFCVNMLAASPASMKADKEEVSIAYEDAKTSTVSVAVVPEGESVSIVSYALVQEEGKEYFTIGKDGTIRVNPNFSGEILPGNYPISVKVTTHAGETVYENVTVIKITSKPISLTYPAASGSVEVNASFVSGLPAVKGSAENLRFALKSVQPTTDKISVDAATGAISVPEGNALAVGNHFDISVTVSNDYGSVDFENAFAIDVVAYIAPIVAESFKYASVEVIQATAFEAPKDGGFAGDEVKFSLVDVPEALAGQISIDESTGAVSAVKGNSIPLGSYTVKVKAENIKGTAEAELKISVIENPYFFTYIRYGNNLGLASDGSFASQWRAATAAEFAALSLTPVTDAKAGVALEWSVKVKHQCKGTSIDASTGVLTFSSTGFKANNGGLVLVTAIAGKGTPGEVSVTVPVFFSFIGAVNGVTIHYNPFVVQANPRKGITSSVPEISGLADTGLLLMDYRRTFNFYNIAGPHTDGQPSAAGSLMNQLWKAYFTSIGSATVNTGSKDPVSYYSNSSRLASALAYIKADTKELVVNPNKWIGEDNVPANGAFIGQVTFVKDGNAGGVNSGSQIFPFWIWFDEKF